MSKANEVTFMHTFETIEDCRNHVSTILEPAIVVTLFNGERSLYTFAVQSSVDIMQEQINEVRAKKSVMQPFSLDTLQGFKLEDLQGFKLEGNGEQK